MEHATIFVVSGEAADCDPLLAHLGTTLARPIFVSDFDKVTVNIQDSAVALIVLRGSHEFCEPFLSVFSELRTKHVVPPLLIVATRSSEAFAIAALRAGAAEYLTDPIDATILDRFLSRCIPDVAPRPAETDLAGGEVLVGGSPVMQALRTQIRRLAATDCNVLITGETGTGKELVAQLIHQNSPRKANPLICINCAAIPDSLLESELFGYERGAFTGAGWTNQGKLMAANRGTVFFDEIGDMTPLAQAKVLRAIETKEVQRLGATRRYDADIRILGATHQNLDDLASAETFRRDLYFRLNVGRIYLPPLRERKADIGMLVERMVTDLNRKLGRRVDGVSNAGLRSLAQYDWPGNVRELKNVIERVFITIDGGRIGAEELSRVLPQRSAPAPSPREEEVHSIQEALATCNGNKSRAAEKLNWSRMTLYRKLAKYKSSGKGLSSSNS